MPSALLPALGKAFDDPVLAGQRCFRAILAAMSEPGTPHRLAEVLEPPAGLGPAATQILLTLADAETPVWLPSALGEAAAYVRFHCGAMIVEDPARALFAVVDGSACRVGEGKRPLVASFAAGDERYPDRSATVIVACEALTGGNQAAISGPGIKGERHVAPRGLPDGFWPEAAANHERYPLGVDFILAARDEILCLPRSTRIVVPRAEAR